MREFIASVVIVSWNTRSLTLRCIDSLHEQDIFDKLLVIVVDNGSADGTVELLREKYKCLGNLKIIAWNDNKGFAKANNAGIKIAQGNYIILMNSDIYFTNPYLLHRLLELMDNNPDVGLGGPALLNPDGSLQPSCKKELTLWRTLWEALGIKYLPFRSFFEGTEIEGPLNAERQDVDTLAGAFWIVRRAVIEEIGLLDETFFFYGEDVDYCKRVRDAGWKVSIFPSIKVFHVGGASTKDPIKATRNLTLAKTAYWRKYSSASKFLLFVLIMIIGTLLRIVVFYLSKTNKLSLELQRLKQLGTELATILCKTKVKPR